MLGLVARDLRFASPHFVHKKSSTSHSEKTTQARMPVLHLTSMFAHLRGVLLEKHPNQAVVEAGGVGYDVTIAVPTFTRLPDVGAEVKLRIHTHVREDALSLYGFLSQDEKALFEKL